MAPKNGIRDIAHCEVCQTGQHCLTTRFCYVCLNHFTGHIMCIEGHIRACRKIDALKYPATRSEVNVRGNVTINTGVESNNTRSSVLRISNMAGFICNVYADETWSLYHIMLTIEDLTNIPIREQKLLVGIIPLETMLPLPETLPHRQVDITLIRCTPKWNPFHCDDCNISTNGPKAWEEHLISKKHARKSTNANLLHLVR